jgi:hypothetical protein
MFLTTNNGSLYEIIAMILFLTILIIITRFFGNIIYALFCYDTCCMKKQSTQVIPAIPANAIQTIVPFAEAVITQQENNSEFVPISIQNK